MTQATSRPPAVETSGLTVEFGAVRALRDLAIRVSAGESLAVFGPNGAGKTTLIRVLTLSLRPNRGRFRICGLDPRRDDREIRQQIGVISHQSYLYDELTARQNLEFFCRLYGVPRPAARALELLDSMRLAQRAGDPVRTLSRGMQQRVSLARSLVHDPGLIFLDEPFTGLDPHAGRMLRDTLERLRRERRTVLLVTHDLSLGLQLSDRWLLMSHGTIVDQGRSPETDPSEFEASYLARFAQRAESQ